MILILTQCFPSRLGGVESLVSNLALGLSDTEDVCVFADTYHKINDAKYDNYHINKISVTRVSGLKFFRRRKKIKAIKPLIDSNKVKLIIGDSWKSLELGINYFNSKKIPTICLAHGNEILSKNKTKKQRIINTINKTSLVVANSIFTKNLLKKLNINNVNIKYIYPGAADLRNNIPIKISNIKGNPIILTLARIEKRKGHEIVITSVAKLINKYPNIKYIIAGDGPEKKYLQQLVLDNNLSKNINFVGNINEGQKKYLFEKTDLMIMPTLDESLNNSIEGFGISYLEAAFFAIPSIASDIGGTSEAVINNSTGIVLGHINQLDKAITDLLKDNDKRISIGRSAQKRAVKDFNWKKVTQTHLSLYRNLSLYI